MNLLALVTFMGVVAFADGAAFARFVNTVPATVSTKAISSDGAAAAIVTSGIAIPTAAVGEVYPELAQSTTYSVLISSRNYYQDVVGLKIAETAGTIASYIVMQTGRFHQRDILAQTTAVQDEEAAQEFWFHALHPLRGDHSHVSAATNPDDATQDVAIVNRLCIPQAGLTAGITTADSVEGTQLPSIGDLYRGEYLRADGIMGYLSFAAGSYKFRAYGVVGHHCGAGGGCTLTPTTTNGLLTGSRSVYDFAGSETIVTFEDEKTYSLVTYGDAKWTSATSANTVKLAVFEESTAQTTFGYAAVRFFHGMSTYSAEALTVYSGRTTSTATVSASAIAFGTVSQYEAVAPYTSQVFPLEVAGSVVASSTTVMMDIRAGSRVTNFCAHNDDNLKVVFCRQIPSRVVAYVRLINNLGSVSAMRMPDANSHVLTSNSKLSLVATYAFAGSEDLGVERIAPLMPAHTALPPVAAAYTAYPVVEGVTVDTVSGYGDVHVPLPIMDFAMYKLIVVSNAVQSAQVQVNSGHGSFTQEKLPAIYKRVNLVVRSSQGFNYGHMPIPSADTAGHYSGANGNMNENMVGFVGQLTAAGIATTAVLGTTFTITASTTVAIGTTVDSLAGYTLRVISGSAKCSFSGYVGTILTNTAAATPVLTVFPRANTAVTDAVGECFVMVERGPQFGLASSPLSTLFVEPGTAMSVSYGHSHSVIITGTTCTTATSRGFGQTNDFGLSVGLDYAVEQWATAPSTTSGTYALLPTSWLNDYSSATTAAASFSKIVTAPVVSGSVSSSTTDVATITGGASVTVTDFTLVAQLINNRWNPAALSGTTTLTPIFTSGTGISAYLPETNIATTFNTLSPGTYQLSGTTMTGAAGIFAACFTTVPDTQFTVEAGSIYSTHIFGSAACTCSTGTAFDTAQLTGTTVKWAYASAPAAAPAVAAATPFFGGASAVSAPVALVLAAVLAILAIAF